MVDIKIGSELMAADEYVKSNNSSRSFLSLLQTLFREADIMCLEANDWRILKQKLETLLYSRPWHMEEIGRLKRTTSLLFKVSDILYGPA